MGAQAFVDGISFDTKKLDELTLLVKLRTSAAVLAFGLKIMAEAAINAPVDTGALRGSILSESHLEEPLLFIVQDGVEYGAWVEFGTSRQAAQPFFIPAIENNRDKLEKIFADIFKI